MSKSRVQTIKSKVFSVLRWKLGEFLHDTGCTGLRRRGRTLG